MSDSGVSARGVEVESLFAAGFCGDVCCESDCSGALVVRGYEAMTKRERKARSALRGTKQSRDSPK